jgi:hypothetical protein
VRHTIDDPTLPTCIVRGPPQCPPQQMLRQSKALTTHAGEVTVRALPNIPGNKSEKQRATPGGDLSAHHQLATPSADRTSSDPEQRCGLSIMMLKGA